MKWLEPRRVSRTGLARYIVATVSVAVAVGLYILLDPILQPAMFLLLVPAVVFSAWFGGLGPAVAASVMAVLSADYLYYEPIGEPSVVAASDFVEIVVFLAVSLLISSTVNALRQVWGQEEAARAEAQAATRSREEVLAVVSHDLRNLVGTAQSALEVLVDPEFGEAERKGDLLRITIGSLRRADRLINDLLDVSQNERGMLELRLQTTDLTHVVEEVVASHREMAQRLGVDLVLEGKPETSPARLDPDRLSRVCDNLVGNALRHTPAGGKVSLRVERVDDEWVVGVTDTGPGIRDEDRDRIFQAFWHGADQGGAGLGLAISKTLVEAHGGSLWVESKPGRGSTFRFSIPATAQDSPERLARTAAPLSTDAGSRPKRY